MSVNMFTGAEGRISSPLNFMICKWLRVGGASNTCVGDTRISKKSYAGNRSE